MPTSRGCAWWLPRRVQRRAAGFCAVSLRQAHRVVAGALAIARPVGAVRALVVAHAGRDGGNGEGHGGELLEDLPQNAQARCCAHARGRMTEPPGSWPTRVCVRVRGASPLCTPRRMPAGASADARLGAAGGEPNAPDASLAIFCCLWRPLDHCTPLAAALAAIIERENDTSVETSPSRRTHDACEFCMMVPVRRGGTHPSPAWGFPRPFLARRARTRHVRGELPAQRRQPGPVEGLAPERLCH